jgi:hypothetical protein
MVYDGMIHYSDEMRLCDDRSCPSTVSVCSKAPFKSCDVCCSSTVLLKLCGSLLLLHRRRQHTPQLKSMHKTILSLRFSRGCHKSSSTRSHQISFCCAVISQQVARHDTSAAAPRQLWRNPSIGHDHAIAHIVAASKGTRTNITRKRTESIVLPSAVPHSCCYLETLIKRPQSWICSLDRASRGNWCVAFSSKA